MLDPTGIEATRDFLRTWAELQSTCCTAPAFELIKENRVLGNSRQTGAQRSAKLPGESRLSRVFGRRRIFRKEGQKKVMGFESPRGFPPLPA